MAAARMDSPDAASTAGSSTVPRPVPSGRRERLKADKRARIIRAAREHFAMSGYAATTTAGVAAAADVAAGTLFQYAATKAELLIMTMNDEVEACIDLGIGAARASSTREDAVMAFVAPLLALAADQDENFSVYVREVLFGPPGDHRADALKTVLRYEAHLLNLLAARPDAGGAAELVAVHPEADLPNASRALLFAVLLEISSTRLGLNPAATTAERVRAQLDLILHGILDPSGGEQR